MNNPFMFLDGHKIPYTKFEHEAVSSCEEVIEKLPNIPGSHTKNLFLRDRKGGRHFLVMVGYDKNVDLKSLSALIPADKLSFGSPQRLKEHLGVDPGSVTLLGLLYDPQKKVEVFIDEEVWKAKALQCHPLRNNATLVIPHEGIEQFLAATGHEYKVIAVPMRAA
jgi:Ala-tRNA(Pro) deacylase